LDENDQEVIEFSDDEKEKQYRQQSENRKRTFQHKKRENRHHTCMFIFSAQIYLHYCRQSKCICTATIATATHTSKYARSSLSTTILASTEFLNATTTATDVSNGTWMDASAAATTWTRWIQLI
jgi:hypothetical protein